MKTKEDTPQGSSVSRSRKQEPYSPFLDEEIFAHEEEGSEAQQGWLPPGSQGPASPFLHAFESTEPDTQDEPEVVEFRELIDDQEDEKFDEETGALAEFMAAEEEPEANEYGASSLDLDEEEPDEEWDEEEEFGYEYEDEDAIDELGFEAEWYEEMFDEELEEALPEFLADEEGELERVELYEFEADGYDVELDEDLDEDETFSDFDEAFDEQLVEYVMRPDLISVGTEEQLDRAFPYASVSISPSSSEIEIRTELLEELDEFYTDEVELYAEDFGADVYEVDELEQAFLGEVEDQELVEGFPVPAVIYAREFGETTDEVLYPGEISYEITDPVRISYKDALNYALDNLRPRAEVVWRDGTRSRGFGAPWWTNKFNKTYWVKKKDPARKRNQAGNLVSRGWLLLELKPGRSAYDALIDLPKSSPAWTYECASYIQAAHLYALARSRGRAKVEAWFKTRRPQLRYFRSPGVKTRFYFRKERKTDPWRRYLGNGRWKQSKLDDATLLSRTAIGSRVMWHNIRGKGAWKNENTVKVGPDQYRAFPLFSYRRATGEQVALGLATYGYKNDNPGVNRAALESMVFSDPTDSSLAGLRAYRNANVFLREVAILGPRF